MKICLFNPGFENNNASPSANLGDIIIQEAVVRELKNLFIDSNILHIATHSYPENRHIKDAINSPLIFVGGTNLLGSSMDKYKQWKITLLQKIIVRQAILFGVGWERYQARPNFYTRLSLKAVLSNKFLHSVRDNYTKQQVESAGIKNVVNTGCPTMWPLMDIKPEEIRLTKSDSALVMLTDYDKNPELDQKLLELIASKYEHIYFWPQGRGDKKYFSELTSSLQVQLTLLEHSFESFKSCLESDIAFDYIGTRLHGGIKCLLARRRALIIEIDSRAKEIAKDTNLPTAGRDDFDKIIQWIEQPSPMSIKLNNTSIIQWKSQFYKYQ